MKLWSFRRNRLPTMLKKKVPPVYHRLLLKERKLQKAPAESAFLPRRPLLFWWQKYRGLLGGIILAIAVFGVLAIIFFLSGIFDVREIALTRQDLRVNVPAISRVLSNLKGAKMLTVSEASIRDLLNKFPEIATITLKKDWPNRITIELSTFPVVAKWEFREAPKKQGAATKSLQTLFVNMLGNATAAAPEEEKQTFLLYEEVPTNIKKIATGANIFPAPRLQEILEARDLLKAAVPFPVTGAKILRAAKEVHFETKDGPALWLDFATPLKDQIAKLSAANGEKKLFEKKLQYIDLRIPEKIIYHE